MIPGVNNYFPHLFANRYIHCDFDGRAFTRNCQDGLKWVQSALSCLPMDFMTVSSHFQKVSEKPTILEADLDELERLKEIERQNQTKEPEVMILESDFDKNVKPKEIETLKTEEPQVIILEADKGMLDLKVQEDSLNADLEQRKNAFIERQKVKTLRMTRPRQF